MKGRVQVLIADDSPSVRRLLSSYLSAEEDFDVVATAADGDEAVAAVERFRPDVITLDVDMPGLDGLAALRRIMGRFPTPAVMISGAGSRAARRTLQALEQGAVDFILKFEPGHNTDPEALRREIVSKVRAAANIRTVRTVDTQPASSQPSSDPGPPVTGPPSSRALRTGVVVVGASTGGPVALRQILSALPVGFSQPIVVVQHIPATFISVLAAQLARHTQLDVRPAADGDALRPGTVLIAPGDVHLLLASDGRAYHHAGPPVHGHCPAIDVTMQSAARAFGSRARGVLLTGMGDDGAEGLCAIRVAGGQTLAQDEASSVVWGMPARAVEKGGVSHLAPPTELAHELHRMSSLAYTEPIHTPPEVLQHEAN